MQDIRYYTGSKLKILTINGEAAIVGLAQQAFFGSLGNLISNASAGTQTLYFVYQTAGGVATKVQYEAHFNGDGTVNVGDEVFTALEASAFAAAVVGVLVLSGVALEGAALLAVEVAAAALYTTFIDPAYVVYQDLTGTSVNVQLANQNGDVLGGAVYVDGLESTTELEAVHALLVHGELDFPVPEAGMKVVLSSTGFVDETFYVYSEEILERVAEFFFNDSVSSLINYGTNAALIAERASSNFLFARSEGQDDVIDRLLLPNTLSYDGTTIPGFNPSKIFLASGVGFATEDDALYLGTTGGQTVTAGDGHDWIFGGSGDDVLNGDAGNDWIFGDDGLLNTNATMLGDDIIDGGAGDDHLYGGAGMDNIIGGLGNDTIYGGDGDDEIDGGDGADKIYGQGGNNVINAGSGDDSIYVQQNDPTWSHNLFNGGDGADTLFSSIYRSAILGNGITIKDSSEVPLYKDGDVAVGIEKFSTSSFVSSYFSVEEMGNTFYINKTYILPLVEQPTQYTTLSYKNYSKSLIFDLRENENVITDSNGVEDRYYDSYSAPSSVNSSVISIVGSDNGDEYYLRDMTRAGHLPIFSGSGDDLFHHSVYPTPVFYGGGDDVTLDTDIVMVMPIGVEVSDISHSVVNVEVTVSHQYNTISWTADLLVEINGYGSIRYEDALSLHYKTDYDPWFTHPETGERYYDAWYYNNVHAGAIAIIGKDDVKVLGFRSDAVENGFGMPTPYMYVESLDSNQWLGEAYYGTLNDDIIDLGDYTLSEIYYAYDGNDTIISGSSNNEIYGGAGIDSVRYSGNYESYSITDNGSHIIVSGAEGTDTLFSVERLQFNDFTYSTVKVDAPVEVEGEKLYGSFGDDVVIGAIFSNWFEGYSGDDIFVGNDGNDRIDGGEGDDIVDGGTGNDILYIGAGEDTATGGDGSDVFIIQLGNGETTITDFTIGVDKIDLKNISGINGFDDLLLNWSSGDTKISLDGGQAVWLTDIDSWDLSSSDFIFGQWQAPITINYPDVPTTVRNGSASGESLYAISGAGEVINGLGGNDYLYGYYGDDYLYGGDGNDYLYGYGGDDVLNGEGGSDHLRGGAGDDIYVMDINDGGGDDISDSDGIDTIELPEELSILDISFSEYNDNLYIYSSNYNYDWSGVYIYDQFDGGAVEYLIVQGTIYDLNEVYLNGFPDDILIYPSMPTTVQNGDSGNNYLYVNSGDGEVINGYAGDDTIDGWYGNDYLYGGDGDDYLWGEDGNDVLFGGDGFDILEGGYDHDIYVIDINDSASDTIWDYDGNDTIVIPEEISTSDLSFSVYFNNLHIESSNANYAWSSSSIIDYFNGSPIENIVVQGIKYDLNDMYLNGFPALPVSPNEAPNAFDDEISSTRSAAILGSVFDDNGNGVDYDPNTIYLEVDAIDSQVTGGHLQLASNGQFTFTPDEGFLNEGAPLSFEYTLRDEDGNETTAFISFEFSQLDLLGTTSNDVLYSTINNEDIVGDTGVDTISYESAVQGIVASLVTNSALGDGYDTYTGIENITGSDYDDRITGDANANILAGGGGNDILIGGAGNDVLNGGDGTDTADYSSATAAVKLNLENGTGDEGWDGSVNDTLISIENVIGSAYADFIYGSNSTNHLWGGAGNDEIRALDDDDFLYGGDDNDILFGGYGDDYLEGGNGDDQLNGQGHDDTIYGQGGDDQLWGETGNDTLYGGAGNDDLRGNEGMDELYGDAGDDDLYGGDGSDTLYGGDDGDRLYGESDNDILYGEAGNDLLRGDAGNDTLYGGSGVDDIRGGSGNDILIDSWDGDRDYIEGDGDTDTFTFLWGGGGNYNIIGDFDSTIDSGTGKTVEAIDISDILDNTDWDGQASTLEDYVTFVDNGSHSVLRVDIDGTGSGASFASVARLNNEAGLLLEDVNLITA